jgi:putative tryptophan/tyrosine transport system substrate-binding protein
MQRRKFIKLIAAVAALPFTVRAQQRAMPIVGFINSESSKTYARFLDAFRQGLRQKGFIEGRNVVVQYRWGENDNVKTNDFIAEFVRLPVDAIVTTGGDRIVLQASAATKAIPVIANFGSDPVETGLIKSINRPGGNVTGVSVFSIQLVAKRLELARDLTETAALIAFLVNPDNPNSQIDVRELERAAKGIAQPVLPLRASNESEFETVFTNLAQQGAKALIVDSDPYFNSVSARLVALARSHAIPTVFPRREFATAGGLMSYGSSLTEAYRQLGIYTGSVLKGDKPADLPFVLPTRFDLVVNLNTARSLGITMPTGILLLADEVIE